MESKEKPVSEQTTTPPAMERRRFLQTMGSAVGLAAAATLAGPDDVLRTVEAAAQSLSGLSPKQAAREESFWLGIQQAFTMSRSLINLDNAWTCPSPRLVTEAVVRYTWLQEEEPAQQWIQKLRPRQESVRIGLARLFGCDPEEIALVRNATEALQIVLFGIPLKSGDEVLTTSLDYGSMVSTLNYRQQRDGIVLKRIDMPTPPKAMEELVGAFERAITPKTRLILVSHIAYLNGQVFPIKNICDLAHQRGIEVVVDGAHSFAHLDFTRQDLDCDYFGTSLHKWLLAPKGTGLLYVRKDKIETIPPLMSAPSGRRKANIRKFEQVGTHPAAPILAIAEALSFHTVIGSKRKEERLRYLKDYWAERLRKVPNVRLYTSLQPEMSCGIATVGVEGVHPVAFRDYLWERHRVQTARIVSAGIQGLRVSPNLYTTLNELDYFCEVVEDVAKKGLPEPHKSFKPDDTTTG